MVCKRVYEITKVILNEVFKNEVGFLDKDLESISTRQYVVVSFFRAVQWARCLLLDLMSCSNVFKRNALN